MENNKQNKVLKFKDSKVNKYLNKFNLFLFVITASAYILFFFLIVLLSGLSMWSGVSEVGVPLTVSPYNNITSVDGVNIHLSNFENKTLRYDVSSIVRTSDESVLSTSSEFGNILKLYLNNEEVDLDINNDYIIPEGTYNLKLEMSVEVKVETYKGVTSTKVKLVDVKDITVSNAFRPLSIEDDQTNINLITSDSNGKFAKEIYRTPMYQRITKILMFTLIYTILNIIKIVILYFFTKDAKINKKL